MTADRAETWHGSVFSDEELIARVKAMPEVQARAEALVARIKSGELREGGAGITADELPDFLRELRR